MAEENQEQNAGEISDAEIQQASTNGWVPQEKYQGDGWMDARAYNKRTESVMPLLKATNKRISMELQGANTRLGTLEERLRAQEVALAAVSEEHVERKGEDLAAKKARIKGEIAAANREGEFEEAADLADELTQVNLDIRGLEAGGEKKLGSGGEEVVNRVHPEVQTWFDSHEELVKDPRWMRLALVVQSELRSKGDKRVGHAFMEDVSKEVADTLGTRPANPGKGLGGNGGSSRGGGGFSGGKTYADLPAEAKQAAARMTTRLVGEGKKFKDEAAWHKHYANEYFKGEAA